MRQATNPTVLAIVTIFATSILMTLVHTVDSSLIAKRFVINSDLFFQVPVNAHGVHAVLFSELFDQYSIKPRLL